jgi:hypothetical protein
LAPRATLPCTDVEIAGPQAGSFAYTAGFTWKADGAVLQIDGERRLAGLVDFEPQTNGLAAVSTGGWFDGRYDVRYVIYSGSTLRVWLDDQTVARFRVTTGNGAGWSRELRCGPPLFGEG